MGRAIDLDRPLSEEDKAYLRRRSRGNEILANERRFGVDGKAEPAPHEAAGEPRANFFYDSQERDKAVYDVGGAPLPGTVLDRDTGRVYDRENGVLVEYTGPGPAHSGYPSLRNSEGFDERSDDGSDIDEDIVDEISELDEKQLLKRLEDEGIAIPEEPEDVSHLNVDALKEKLVEEGVPISADDKKADLQSKLNKHLEKRRFETMQDRLAVHLQDERDGKH